VKTNTFVNQLKDVPIVETITIGTEWFLLITGLLLSSVGYVIHLISVLLITGAARLNGKEESYKSNVQLSNYDLALHTIGLIRNGNAKEDEYLFDHKGKELPLDVEDATYVEASDHTPGGLSSSSEESYADEPSLSPECAKEDLGTKPKGQSSKAMPSSAKSTH